MDYLEERIRAARPPSGHRDLPLPERAKRELAELRPTGLLHERRKRRQQIVRRVGVTLTLAAGVVATVATAISLTEPSNAYAATPPLLEATPIAGSAGELLTLMSRSVDQTTQLQSTGDVTIQVQAWTLEVRDNGRAASSVVIPKNYEITSTTEGSRHVVVTAGRPLDRNGVKAEGNDVPHKGERLSQETWGPGEYPYLFLEPFPEDPADVGPYFANALGLGKSLTASESIQATNDLLLEQKLAPRQEVALLEYFAALPDLRVTGGVTDRVGRHGVDFVADAPGRPEYRSHLIVCPKTGRILASEVVYVGNVRADIPSPSVVNYFAWK